MSEEIILEEKKLEDLLKKGLASLHEKLISLLKIIIIDNNL
ncbi:MAG: hypothetical protein RXR31_02855 [Thermoproteota archaeon]